jgi:hypothetical protein
MATFFFIAIIQLHGLTIIIHIHLRMCMYMQQMYVYYLHSVVLLPFKAKFAPNIRRLNIHMY